MKAYQIGPITIFDPELHRSLFCGVYQAEDGKYRTASSVRFQDNSKSSIKFGGELRDRPHFMVRGYDVTYGEPRLNITLAAANIRGNLSREEVLEMVRESLPEVVIYDTLAADIALGAARLEKEVRNFLSHQS